MRNVSASDNLCFFRCLALHRGANPHKCEKAAKKLFRKYCAHFDVAPGDFAGVQLFDFIHLEDFFELNLIAYELDGKVAKLVQRSCEFYQETMRLNVFGNHLSVIVDFELYCGVCQCVHCDKLWDHSGHYYRHTKSCTTTVCEIFPGSIHKNPATIFEKLEEIGIVVENVTLVGVNVVPSVGVQNLGQIQLSRSRQIDFLRQVNHVIRKFVFRINVHGRVTGEGEEHVW